MSPTSRDRWFTQIWDTVAEIPVGRVASYGQVAEAAGLPRRARLVGRALRELPEGSAVPWFRVINASGRISVPGYQGASLQQELLESEGVEFTNGRVDLKRYGWKG